jgi:hypothetical protein
MRLPIDEQKEIIKRSLDELSLKDLEKKDLYDYFVSDPTLFDKKKELLKPIKNKMKYCGLATIVWTAGLIVYARNAHYYTLKFFPNMRRKGVIRLAFISLGHSILLIGSFIFLNCLVTLTNPNTLYKNISKINREIEDSDPYKDAHMTDFLILYAEIEHTEEKKALLLNQLKEKIANENKTLNEQNNSYI